MLMKNIDQAAGLCNGTRVMVNELGRNVIGASSINWEEYRRQNSGTQNESGANWSWVTLQIPKETVSPVLMFCNDDK